MSQATKNDRQEAYLDYLRSRHGEMTILMYAPWAEIYQQAEAATVTAIVGAAREYIAEARDHRYYSPTAHWDRVLSMVDWIEHGGWKKP